MSDPRKGPAGAPLPFPVGLTVLILRFAIFTLVLTVLGTGARAETINVNQGGDLQDALYRAQPGDEVVLQAGATFSGNFVLPVKSGESYVTVRSSRSGELPEGARVSLSDAAKMARLETPNVAPVLRAPSGAHHYRFVGVEFTQGASVGQYGYNLIELGEDREADPARAAHHLEFDRCIVRARDSLTAVQRGITLNSASTVVKNSHISDIKWAGVETQAVGGWNGPGPFLIENNFLEAAGVNILFGGAPSANSGMMPSDITIRGNRIFKRPEWYGTQWTVKNLFELKSARRVVFDANDCENSWPMAQTGWAVILNAGGDSGAHSVIEDVQIVNSRFRNIANGINLRGMEDGDVAPRMRRVRIANNTFENVGAYSGESKLFQMLRASDSVTVDHNTARDSRHAVLIIEAAPGFRHTGLAFTNNLVAYGYYGVFGDGGSLGAAALDQYASGWTFAGNALVATPDDLKTKYPTSNFFPATAADAAGLIGTDGLPVGASGYQTAPLPSPTPQPSPSPSPTPASSTPSVSITTPTNSATLNAGTYISITATASSSVTNIARVDFYADGQFIGATATAPYNVSWGGATVGNHSLAAKATDGKGASAWSSPVMVNVAVPSNVAPSVSITSPAASAEFIEGADITISALAADTDGSVAKVDFYAGTQFIGATATNYVVLWNRVPAGDYALTAVATDNSGGRTTSTPVYIRVSKPKGVRSGGGKSGGGKGGGKPASSDPAQTSQVAGASVSLDSYTTPAAGPNTAGGTPGAGGRRRLKSSRRSQTGDGTAPARQER